MVFPFEEDLYRGLTDVTFVGHPALDSVHPTRTRAEVREELGVQSDAALVAILPGSRSAEVRSLLPAMSAALDRLGRPVDGVVALAHPSLRADVEELAPDLAVVEGQTWDLVAAADLVLVASGSASPVSYTHLTLPTICSV